ncbi:MAG: aminotransferase class III-fold pyridoxal phosphate-dependent enzyme [Caulobacteraceae bacterium]
MTADPDWFTEGLPHVWLPYAQMKTALAPLAAVRTHGARIVLADGRELIDGGGELVDRLPRLQPSAHRRGGAPAAGGHAACHVRRLAHEPALTLARRLCALLGNGLGRVFFSDSGSVAVEVAMKMAVQFWLNQGVRGRTKFVAFRGGYHGDTLATMAVCDPDEGMHSLFAGALAEHLIVDLPRDEAGAAALDAVLARHAGEVAGILVEPLVQGAGGMIFHEPQVLARLRAAADRHGLLLISTRSSPVSAAPGRCSRTSGPGSRPTSSPSARP